MIDHEQITTLDDAALRSAERRRFLSLVGRSGAAAGGLALLSACGSDSSSSTPTPTPSASATASIEAADITILKFALQLEYLSGQYFSLAATGAGLPASDLTGSGTQGNVTGGALVPFTDPQVAAVAREMARDDRAHVEYLRSLIGTTPTAQPAINIDSGTGAFATLMQNAGIAGFNPYASDVNFLIGALILKDVIATAYKGLVPLIGTPSFIAGAAGVLGTEAYHAGLIRTLLYQKAVANSSILSTVAAISTYRDSLDGSTTLDKGIAGADSTISNIAPVDGNGITFSRTTGQVLNILFLNKAAVTTGGFYPAGVNGTVNTSAASG